VSLNGKALINARTSLMTAWFFTVREPLAVPLVLIVGELQYKTWAPAGTNSRGDFEAATAGTVESAKVAPNTTTTAVARRAKRPRAVTFPEGPLAQFLRPRHEMV
jgi:hypothetical protein